MDNSAVMNAERPHYDHRKHAGNPGDIWKHFILAEAADCLLRVGRMHTYAESHVGYQNYILNSTGEWEGGIGRCWPRISALKVFRYFRVILEMNPQELICYPGSASLVLDIARKHGCDIDMEVWDNNPNVAASWLGDPRVNFHFEDGFIGVSSVLDRLAPGMILIDPPYLDENDARQAMNLLSSAKKAGWVVLWWQMVGEETAPSESMRKYTLMFNDIDLGCDRWQGAIMEVAGGDEKLIKHLDMQTRLFLDLACWTKSF